MKYTLYRRRQNGGIDIWQIWGTIHSRDTGSIFTAFGQNPDNLETASIKVTTNKSGRNIREQIRLEMTNRIVKKQRIGYRKTIDNAIAFANKNTLDLDRPMLAQTYKPRTHRVDYWIRQFKYDGHRMLVNRVGRSLRAYTRSGKLIQTMDHILNDISIPEGLTLDGELYLHNTSLQQLASLIKREQKGTTDVVYMVYDVMCHSSPVPFKERLSMVNSMTGTSHVKIAPSWTSDRPIIEDLHQAQEMGYEGIMLRNPDGMYESGKRSKNLLKVKSFMDAEFIVRDITENDLGWAILHCDRMGKIFTVVAPGTVEDKVEVAKNKSKYIGKQVTVKYSALTDAGLPFHPIATVWRED